jgi:hypothetical protein
LFFKVKLEDLDKFYENVQELNKMDIKSKSYKEYDKKIRELEQIWKKRDSINDI